MTTLAPNPRGDVLRPRNPQNSSPGDPYYSEYLAYQSQIDALRADTRVDTNWFAATTRMQTRIGCVELNGSVVGCSTFMITQTHKIRQLFLDMQDEGFRASTYPGYYPKVTTPYNGLIITSRIAGSDSTAFVTKTVDPAETTRPGPLSAQDSPSSGSSFSPSDTSNSPPSPTKSRGLSSAAAAGIGAAA